MNLYFGNVGRTRPGAEIVSKMATKLTAGASLVAFLALLVVRNLDTLGKIRFWAMLFESDTQGFGGRRFLKFIW
jgi:hypothetical protein